MAFLLLLAKSYLSFKIQFRYHLLLEAFSDSSRLNEQTLLCSFTSDLALTTEFVSVHSIVFPLGAFFEDKDMPHIPGFPIPSPGLVVPCMFNRSEHACSNRPSGPKSVSTGDAGH